MGGFRKIFRELTVLRIAISCPERYNKLKKMCRNRMMAMAFVEFENVSKIYKTG